MKPRGPASFDEATSDYRAWKDPDWLYVAAGRMADRVVEDLAASR